MPLAPISLVPALVSSLVAWRVYRRVRLNIGRQPYHPRRLLARALIFALITVGLAAFTHQPRMLLGLAGGLLPGLALGWLGLRLTRFEATSEGRFYTPNTYIGVALSLLMAGRLLYRMIQLHAAPNLFTHPHPPAMKSPLTLFIFGLLAGYYVIYLGGVHLRCRRMTSLETARPSRT